MSTASQKRLIRAALERGERITPMDALRLYGCFRLGARIWELRHQDGLPITTDMVPAGDARVAEYRLERV